MEGKKQAGKYARKIGLNEIVVVLFLAGVSEEEAMSLQTEEFIEGVNVIVEPVVIYNE